MSTKSMKRVTKTKRPKARAAAKHECAAGCPSCEVGAGGYQVPPNFVAALRASMAKGGFIQGKTRSILLEGAPHPSVGGLTEKLLRAARATYRADPMAAGLVLSYLVSDRWYASVCRYPNGHKKIVVHAYGSTLLEALHRAARQWYAAHAPPERATFDALRAALDGAEVAAGALRRRQPPETKRPIPSEEAWWNE